jgi:hypothetical protein
MTFKFLKIIGIGFILSVSTLANATLIDNGDYSTDTESGLDWLDWTETINMTQSEALIDFSGAGWRVATATEAVGLIENHFEVVIGGWPSAGIVSMSSVVGFNEMQSDFFGLLGLTGSSVSRATLEGFGLIGASTTDVYAGFYNTIYGEVGYSNPTKGVAMVKAAAVSEPAIIALFALGLVGIGFARRRQY